MVGSVDYCFLLWFFFVKFQRRWLPYIDASLKFGPVTSVQLSTQLQIRWKSLKTKWCSRWCRMDLMHWRHPHAIFRGNKQAYIIKLEKGKLYVLSVWGVPNGHLRECKIILNLDSHKEANPDSIFSLLIPWFCFNVCFSESCTYIWLLFMQSSCYQNRNSSASKNRYQIIPVQNYNRFVCST